MSNKHLIIFHGKLAQSFTISCFSPFLFESCGSPQIFQYFLINFFENVVDGRKDQTFHYDCVNLQFFAQLLGKVGWEECHPLNIGGKTLAFSINQLYYGGVLCNNTMKANNFRLPNKESAGSHYRQSVSILSSELARNSLSGDASRPNIYRESLGLQGKSRNTMNLEMVQHLRREFEYQRREKDRASISNLKSTLSELEKKISKAKRQLNTYKNIISEEESDDEPERPRPAHNKTPSFEEISTTVASSQSKLQFLRSELDLAAYPRLKTYYLAHLAAAIEGKNQRALDHLIVSLKVLRNYYKIESPSFAEIEERKVNLPRARTDMGKKTLILDIDETIIHCEEDPSKPHDIMLPIEIENGSTAEAYITIRPYAISFLKRMSRHYEIIAFTASHESYADVVLDELDPEREYIRHRLYRKNCVEIHQNIYAKDLRIINRDLSSMVLVDNAPYSYIFQLENGIPILPYYSGEDSELVQLEKYLQEMAKCQDVREFNKKNFQFHKYCNFNDLENLVMELYLKET